MKLFVGGYISRESCAHCQFKGYKRVSDLTIGDFWGIWDIAPDMDDNMGTSVVLVQSEKGGKLLAALENKLVLKELSLEEASRENTAMVRTSPLNPKRDAAFALIRSGRLSELDSWFRPPRPTVIQRIKRLGKSFLRKLFRK